MYTYRAVNKDEIFAYSFGNFHNQYLPWNEVGGNVIFSVACVNNSVHNYRWSPKHTLLVSGWHASCWNAFLF